MPVALRVFAEAAKEAGLSTSGTTKELFKLMEKGLIPAQKIMPFVSKGFSKFANKNDALTIAMTKLNKRYDVAKDSMLDFNEAAFGRGVESGLSFLLNGFNDLMKSSKFLSTVLGGVFKGAVIGLTAPFRLLHAVIFDITKLMGLHNLKTFNLDILNLTSTILGLVAGLWAVKKAFGALRGIRNIAGGMGGGKGGKVGGKGSGIMGMMGVQKVFVVNMGGGMGGVGGAPSKGGGKGGALKGVGKTLAAFGIGVGGAITGVVTSLVAGVLFLALDDLEKGRAPTAVRGGAKFLPSAGLGARPSQSYQYGTQQPQKVEVKLALDTPMFKAEVESIADSRVNNANNSVYD